MTRRFCPDCGGTVVAVSHASRLRPLLACVWGLGRPGPGDRTCRWRRIVTLAAWLRW